MDYLSILDPSIYSIPHVPSSHAIGIMTIALGINNKIKPCGIILILLSIIVAISRVYIGHHYPSDVIGGFAIAFIVNFMYTNFVDIKIRKIVLNLK